MRVLHEFKEFALKGNVIDLAVGVVIGAAFGRVVSSLVDHLIMPPVGLLMAGVDFPNWQIVIREAMAGKPEVALRVGLLLNAMVQFVLVALAIFVLVRLLNHAMRKEMQVAPPPTPQELLLREIRDLLKTRAGEDAKPPVVPPAV